MASSHSMAHFATQVEQSWNEKRREDHQHMCHSPYAIVPQWSIWRKILPGKKILWPYRSLNKCHKTKYFEIALYKFLTWWNQKAKLNSVTLGWHCGVEWCLMVLEFSARANTIGFKTSNIVYLSLFVTINYSILLTKTWSDHYFKYYFDCAYWHWKGVMV